MYSKCVMPMGIISFTELTIICNAPEQHLPLDTLKNATILHSFPSTIIPLAEYAVEYTLPDNPLSSSHS